MSNDFINLYSKAAFETLKLGDPMNEDTNIGPLGMLEQVEDMQSMVDDAISMGGSITIGGT